MSGPGPRTRAFVSFTIRHGLALWLAALALSVPAAYRTATLYLHLRSDIEALLPRKAPSVLALNELRARMPGLQHLGVIVDTGGADRIPAGERLLDDLAGKLRAYPPELVRSVRTGSDVERRFLEKNAVLYVDAADLREIRERIERRRDYEVTKGMDLALDDEPPPPLDFSDIKKKYEHRAGQTGSGAEQSRFSNAEQHTTLLVIELGSFDTGRSRSGELFNRVKADVAALGGPDHYAPGMRVGYTGDVAISVEETSALMADLSLSSILVILAVMFVLIAYYRWWWSVVVLLPPLLIATVYSFALASLPPFSVAELNSNTAFLGSIIVGNGINFGILLVARYVEERRAGASSEESLMIASWGARAGTLAASLAAGVSYTALSITSFQGFRQFGIIGGIGMLMSWAAAQVLIPPLIYLIDGNGKRAPKPRPAGRTPAGMVGEMVARMPGLIALLCLVVVVLAAFELRHFGPGSLESDFSKLRRADTWVSGEGYWGRKMDALLGTYLTPIVILTDTGQEARRIADRFRAGMDKPPLSTLVSSIRTLDDVLPVDQDEKLKEASALRRVITPRIRGEMSDDERKAVDRLLGSPDVRKIGLGDLPATFTTGLRERDGHADRAVLVFPRPGHALWEKGTIESFVVELRKAANDSGGRPGRVAGSFPVSSDILAGIQRDGPLASLMAFLGVMLTVVAVFRFTRTTLVVLTSLSVGVLWLAAGTLWLGVRINFANFIAFPITFGIGVDYAVNVMTRYVQDGSRDVTQAIRSTGGAVALCSSTTIIGYSSLLLAQNRALYLFGVVAVLGEVACLTSAVIAMPAVLEFFRRKRAKRS